MFKKVIMYAITVMLSVGVLSGCGQDAKTTTLSATMLTANAVALKRQLDAVDLSQFKAKLSADDYRYVKQVYIDSTAVYSALNEISELTKSPDVALTGATRLFTQIAALQQSYAKAYQQLSPKLYQVDQVLANKIRRFDRTAQALNRQYENLLALKPVQDYGPILETTLQTVRIGLTVMSAVL